MCKMDKDKMDKELFEMMVSDWLADAGYEDLVFGEISILEDGRWAIEVEDDKCFYLLAQTPGDDGDLRLEYHGSRR